MNDIDFQWLRRRLPLCHCGAGPRPLNNKSPTIQYLDANDDGSLYVRWLCEGSDTEACHIISSTIKLHGVNEQIKLPPKPMGVVFQETG